GRACRDEEAVGEPGRHSVTGQRLAEDPDPGQVGDEPDGVAEQLTLRGERGGEHPVEREHRDAQRDEHAEDAGVHREPCRLHQMASLSARRARMRFVATSTREMQTPTMPIAAAMPRSWASKARE